MKIYVQAWVYPMAGYKDLDELMQSLDTSLIDQEKQETAVKILMPVENRLRLMLGLAEASETADLWCLEVQNSEDVPEETEESKETDETSMSESATEAVSPDSETQTVESETETESGTPDMSINETETSESETEEASMPESDQPEDKKESEQEGDIVTK